MGTGIGIGWGQGFGWGQDGDGDGNMDGDRMGMGMRMRTWMGTGWGRCIWKGTRSGGRKALLLAVLCWRPMSPALRVRVRTLSPAPGGHAGVVCPLGPCRCRVPPWGHAGVTLAGRAEGGKLGRHVPHCAMLCRAKLCRATLCRTAPCHAARQEARTAGALVPAHF